MKKLSILLLLFLSYAGIAHAQTFIVNGTVKNAKGEPLPAATVFIDGSQKGVVTNEKGEFNFGALAAGTYDIVANMIGYLPAKQTAAVKSGPVSLNIVMKERVIMLNNVLIGKDDKRKEFMKLFVKYFMGESENAKACKMLNPEVIDFSTEKTLVKAMSNDFLVIENPKLGYRIKYLLRNFQYDKKLETTFYEGESVFENLAGTGEQQQAWALNRKKAYEGSLMHYLRAAYRNTSRKEGFLTYSITSIGFPIAIDPNPIIMEQIVQHTDSNFFVFRSKRRLYTVYDPKQAAKQSDKLIEGRTLIDDLGKTGSILQLNAEIDQRGSYARYKDILIQGFWGAKRIGDQLPLEYDPERN
ncbi:carboxypeptidase-like regulatory domain-containing protein [Pedobacter sp. JY14-1]|uniref:carboxypeptidase-like regulatory domain-containing protein n=1 Tax=Pedobacter sp. JY14-1 TaxID=3034151 RepID=UPI0023E1228A|nr:carboxypeptidase-like regulatory domain-containing protein [Pedobacter sp. JY14-1]